VSLYLDDVFGVSVPFPFTNVKFGIGAMARANNDVADATFDNIQVQTVGFAAFSPASVTLIAGQASGSNVVVRIPPGANKTQAVHVTVTSDTPSVAIPVGAVAGALTLTFPIGGGNEQKISVQSLAVGGAIFSLSNDINMGTANTLGVAVILGAGVRLTDDFAGSAVDATKWQTNTTGFESTGIGTFDVSQSGGTLILSGTDDQLAYWPGVALRTLKTFTATPRLPLVCEVDRVYVDPNSPLLGTVSTGARTGVYLSTSDRSKFVFFGQDYGETGWEYNVNPGSPIGIGTTLSAFSTLNDTNAHHIKLVANGSQVEMFLDGQSGGKANFAVTAGIYAELGAYARAIDDSVYGVFDNVLIQNILPPITVSPATVETQQGDNTSAVTITVPALRSSTIAVTIASQDPKVAVPAGAVNGVLTLQFPAGATNSQTFNVVAAGTGQTSFVITNDQAVTVANGVAITVITPLVAWISDDFSAATINSNRWTIDATPLISTGTATADSSVFVTNNQVEMAVTCTASDWPGFAMMLTTGVTASVTSPVTFAVDRVKMDYVLVGGTSAKQRTCIWIKDPTTNYVFFNDYSTFDGTAGGWQYNYVIGSTNDTPLASATAGASMTALNAAALNDLGNHRLKVEVNGTNAKLYVDDILGGTVPFPFANGIVFGFGTYVNFGNSYQNIVYGYFDNAVLSGPQPAVVSLGSLVVVRQADGQVVISWTSAGTLQSATSLKGTWSDVSPAPTGKSYSIAPAAQGQSQYFRLRQ
jgi:hypothetical protein